MSACLQRVTIERYLPYDIREGLNGVKFHKLPETVVESGVEGMTFVFNWELYAGHHLVSGWV